MNKVTYKELLKNLRPGMAITIADGERGILNWMIKKVQTSLLKDLNNPPANIPSYVGFTHTIMVKSVSDTDAIVIENYYPHCREIKLSEKIKVGSTVALSELKFLDEPNEVIQSIATALEDCDREVPYPWWKLFYYYGYRWGWQKTFLGKPAMAVFKKGAPGSKDNNWQVCSGSVWTWWWAGVNKNDIIGWKSNGDKMPEMWYPARIISDTYYVKQEGMYELVMG